MKFYIDRDNDLWCKSNKKLYVYFIRKPKGWQFRGLRDEELSAYGIKPMTELELLLYSSVIEEFKQQYE